MKVYSDSMYGRGTLFVTPGAHHPENSDWNNRRVVEGRVIREPVQFTVTFKNGEAEVPDSLGEYMIDRGLAKASRLIVPVPLSEQLISGLPVYQKPITVGRPLAMAGR